MDSESFRLETRSVSPEFLERDNVSSVDFFIGPERDRGEEGVDRVEPFGDSTCALEPFLPPEPLVHPPGGVAEELPAYLDSS